MRRARVADGSLRTNTSATAARNLGFDAVGIGDVNDDRRPDLVASAAARGEIVDVIANP